MVRTYARVVISDTLFPEFFKDVALYEYSLQVKRVSEKELMKIAKNATQLGVYSTGKFLKHFMQNLSDQIAQKDYDVLFKNEVSLTPDTLFIVISPDPYIPYTSYTCNATLESIGKEKQLINYIDVYCTKH